jgi:hypothetical protein
MSIAAAEEGGSGTSDGIDEGTEGGEGGVLDAPVVLVDAVEAGARVAKYATPISTISEAAPAMAHVTVRRLR